MNVVEKKNVILTAKMNSTEIKMCLVTLHHWAWTVDATANISSERKKK